MRSLERLTLGCPTPPCDGATTVDFLRGIERNTTLTSVLIFFTDIDEDNESDIAFYTTRNKYTPSLATSSKALMMEIFETLWTEGNAGLSVVFDTLRGRDDWYETEDQEKRGSPTKSNFSMQRAKKSRTTI